MSLIIKTADEIAAEKQAQKQERVRQEAKQYLAETDWFVVRKSETGKDIPPDVIKKRKEARTKASK